MEPQKTNPSPAPASTPVEAMPTSPQPAPATSSTKLYENTSDQTLNVLGIGEVPAGERFSVSGQYHPVIILENYPGLVDITEQTNTEVQNEQVK